MAQSTAFRFLDLHPEVCHRILEHTDLVTPLRRIECRAGELSAVLEPPVEAPRHVRIYGGQHDARVPPPPPRPVGWKPPTALFLVSRAFAALAQTVFLSQNHFDIRGDRPFREKREAAMRGELPARLEGSPAADFVSCPMRSKFLPSIKSMYIAWPPIWSAPPLASSQGFRDWREAVDKFKDSLHPRHLTIYVTADCSIPLEREVCSHAPRLRRKVFEPISSIDTVRLSAGMFWPIERLAQTHGVKMFLWDLECDVEGRKVVYYCRHRSESLPRMADDMDLFGRLHPAVIHHQRPFQRGRVGDGEVDCDNEAAAGWVEGVFVRPNDEDESWLWDPKIDKE